MKIRKFLCIGYFADRVFRLVCDTTHDSLQTYLSLLRRTAATSIPPTRRRSLT